MRLLLTLALAALSLSACSGRAEPKGGLSAEEEQRLDNAAKMLDDQMGNLGLESPPEAEADAAAVETQTVNGTANRQ